MSATITTIDADSTDEENSGRKAVDWEAMEPAWRAGIKTKLELSREFNVSRAAIDKHWAKAGIERDLTMRIQAKADALVARQAVTRVVGFEFVTKESEIVDANAGLVASVRMAQREDIIRARKLAMQLMDELEQHNLPKRVARGDLSLPVRTKTMKDLGDTLKTLVGLERQAFSMDKVADDDSNAPRQFVVTYRASPHAES